MVTILTYFLLFALPFLVIPFGNNQFELPKVFAALFFLGFISLSCLFQKKLLTSLPKEKLIIFIILALFTLYHLFFSPYPNLLWGSVWRLQGTILYLGLFLLFLFGHKLPINKNFSSKLAFWSLAILFIFTLAIGPRTSFRFIGPLGEANALGATVLFLFPLAVSQGNKKQKIITTALTVALLLLSGSRSAVLGFLIETAILFVPRKFWLAMLSALTIIYLSAFTLPFLPRQSTSYFFEDRAQIWQVSLQAGFSSPFLGSGFGATENLIKNEAQKVSSILRFQPVDDAHNLFLNWWLSLGLLGVFMIIWIIIRTALNLYFQKSFILLASLLGLLTVQLFNPVSVANLIPFWWILGISFIQQKSSTL